MFDVLIVGGGPAGLSAALVLGRARRRVLVCDAGEPRNRLSRGVNGFLTRDGTVPHELRRLAREDLRKYPSVRLEDVRVADVECIGGHFKAALDDGGKRVAARKLPLAPGVEPSLPPIEGVSALYGRGLFDCPYCD